MKLLFFFLMLCGYWGMGHAEDFLRKWPEKGLLERITPENLKGIDAVIILKEQSFKTEPASVWMGGLEYSGISTTTTRVKIAKLLTEKAVRRYGSFSYTYPERWGDEIPSSFLVKARVLKSNGEEWVMPQSDVQRVVHRTNRDGHPVTRKVLFKVPNLAAGDVVQIEYSITEPLAYARSAVFYYNDEDPVLFSNLYVTLPSDIDAEFVSIPETRVGQPQVTQLSTSYGSGETYFWSIKNLNRLPSEPFAPPFADLSLMTAFMYSRTSSSGMRTKPQWNDIARDYYEGTIAKGKISDDLIRALGFQPNETGITMETVDRLYTALRKEVKLDEVNSLYPVKDIEYIFEKKRGDASDLAFAMFKILSRWKQDVSCVWIRDQRKGTYEYSVPSTAWFDRLGVLVRVGDTEKLFDFDRTISHEYHTPWFLTSGQVVVISPDGSTHKKMAVRQRGADNMMTENHYLRVTGESKIHDSVLVECKGSGAQVYRGEWHDLDDEDISKKIRSVALSSCLSSVDTARHNAFFTEPTMRIEFCGSSQNNVEHVENFMTIRPRNHLVRQLRESLFSETRHNHVVLNSPIKIGMEWHLTLPPEYAIHSQPKDQMFNGPSRGSSRVSYNAKPESLMIKATLDFPETAIPFEQYKALISFLDQVTAGIEREIVLAKK